METARIPVVSGHTRPTGAAVFDPETRWPLRAAHEDGRDPGAGGSSMYREYRGGMRVHFTMLELVVLTHVQSMAAPSRGLFVQGGVGDTCPTLASCFMLMHDTQDDVGISTKAVLKMKEQPY